MIDTNPQVTGSPSRAWRALVVAALLITNDVSLTLVNDGNGWRFYRWTDFAANPIGPHVTNDDRARRFDDVGTAAAYFRGRAVYFLLRVESGEFFPMALHVDSQGWWGNFPACDSPR